MKTDKAAWDHLVKITLANLPTGKINLTESDILDAMKVAVKKEDDMAMQLRTSRRKQDEFKTVLAPLFYESVHAK